MRGRKVDETLTTAEDDFSETFGVPKELVYVVVADDISMIFFLADEFTVDDLITLVTDESIEGHDDRFQIKTFSDWIYSILAFWTAVVVVCAFEDEAKTFWDETNVASFTP